MTANPVSWEDWNRTQLLAAMARVRAALERRPSVEDGSEEGPAAVDVAGGARAASALDVLCATFDLSPFERDVLVLCAGVELDSQWSRDIARAHGDERLRVPTFGLALTVLPGAHWSALTPNRPLRYWRLLEVETQSAITNSPLRIDEGILHYLAGVPSMDVHLHAYMSPVPVPADLAPSHRRTASQIVQFWRAHPASASPLVELTGRQALEVRAIAAAACAELRLGLFALDAGTIPAVATDREWLARLWNREASLHGAVLLIDGDQRSAPHVASFVDAISGHVILTGDGPAAVAHRDLVRVIAEGPEMPERVELWRHALGPVASSLDGAVERVACEFDLSQPQIDSVARQVRRVARDGHDNGDALWQVAQSVSRTRLDGRAERIVPRAGWADLVLPSAQMDALRLMATQLRNREQVYAEWGFARQSTCGLGLSALFAGPSGTGKTMAAEVLARELAFELYRIDLSQVVSKYIGETEKNLKQVFDTAECGGTILLFDEADALFGRRSDVRDSHDRYANIEVSYLLQRMESFRGLAILTTNMKNALDPAFLRRIRFVVQFPFPDGTQRAEIWRRAFPQSTPTENLDIPRLARLNVAGGNIRNIAMNAAFLAADASEPVRMSHLLRAARTEYVKLERTLTDGEIAGWA